jgi:hypothetical protein
MHPRKTITSSVASHRSFQHFRSLREALPSQPDRRKHSRRGRREVLLSEKGLGKFAPPRKPALEELVIQVKDKLEKLPGGLLLRKTPRGKFPPQEFFELGASLPGHMSRPHPTYPGGRFPPTAAAPGQSPEGATFDGGKGKPNRPHVKNRWGFRGLLSVCCFMLVLVLWV